MRNTYLLIFASVDGKQLVKIGDGGCRGLDWNKAGCPKFVGRVNLQECAKECRRTTYCTAFHVLKHDKKDDTHECFIFGHKEVIAVKQLGGTCYTLKAKEEDEEELQLGNNPCPRESKNFF